LRLAAQMQEARKERGAHPPGGARKIIIAAKHPE
jgi:hypothetical protein